MWERYEKKKKIKRKQTKKNRKDENRTRSSPSYNISFFFLLLLFSSSYCSITLFKPSHALSLSLSYFLPSFFPSTHAIISFRSFSPNGFHPASNLPSGYTLFSPRLHSSRTLHEFSVNAFVHTYAVVTLTGTFVHVKLIWVNPSPSSPFSSVFHKEYLTLRYTLKVFFPRGEIVSMRKWQVIDWNHS